VAVGTGDLYAVLGERHVGAQLVAGALTTRGGSRPATATASRRVSNRYSIPATNR
jgi:hypothetical protein